MWGDAVGVSASECLDKQPDDVPVSVHPDEDHAAPVWRVIARDVISATVRGDPLQPAAVSRADRVDAGQAGVAYAKPFTCKPANPRPAETTVQFHRGIVVGELTKSLGVRLDHVRDHAIVTTEY